MSDLVMVIPYRCGVSSGAVALSSFHISDDLMIISSTAIVWFRTFATSSKYSHLIPRPFKMPGSRRLCWYERDVLAWIESTKPAEPPPPRRPRGRPTKAEQIARERWAATTFTQPNT
mgnify:CR=1 FL=1